MTIEESGLHRRTVLTAGALVIAGGTLAACGGTSTPAATASALASNPAPGPTTAGSPTVTASPSATGAPATGALAAVSDIPVGGGVIVAEPPIVITQPVAGTFKGFTAICTHQGCLVAEVAENEIVCPCHGSRFSAEDGSVIQGPATLPLTPADVVVQGASVVLA